MFLLFCYHIDVVDVDAGPGAWKFLCGQFHVWRLWRGVGSLGALYPRPMEQVNGKSGDSWRREKIGPRLSYFHCGSSVRVIVVDVEIAMIGSVCCRCARCHSKRLSVKWIDLASLACHAVSYT